MLRRSSAGEDGVLETILTKRDDEFKATVTKKKKKKATVTRLISYLIIAY